jgi:polyisoprenoid-binding protein YceI
MTEIQNPGPRIDLGPLVGTWRLDPSATTVRLRTKAMWGMATVNGTLRATEGVGTVGEDGSMTGTVVIDAASIDTAQAKRDKHLRGPDFFDVERFPLFTYAVTSAALEGGGLVSILGTFTGHGQTHPLTGRGTVTSADASTITLTVEADLDRSEWGMGWTKMGARLQNHLSVAAVFTRS